MTKRYLVIGRAYDDAPIMDQTQRAPGGGDAHFSGGFAALGRSGVSRRDYKDRRPGTPVPFHEPDPDRFAKAEALRQRILAEEKRRRPKVDPDAPRREVQQTRIKRAELEAFKEPRAGLQCSPENAAVMGQHGTRKIYFRTAADATQAFTGKRVDSGGPVHTALRLNIQRFGWKWTRLRDGRRRLEG
ncbi:MAG TPA: hypothetical protein PL098_00100 [Brevundimonas diminuta]|nr:hypothetical protein [Brevundimonas diminuta]HRL23305.1 hypothetical protein [Brevundimonas diminuta]